MPYANNQGVQIHYEVEGDGPPLLLQHGFSGNLIDWRHLGYVDALKKEFQLILTDARGHGASDKPHEPAAYVRQLMALDLIAVLDALGLDTVHLWGYSMGSTMSINVANVAPHRLSSLILGGSAPGDVPSPELANAAGDPLLAALELGRDGFVAAMDQWAGGLDRYRRDELMAHDTEALRACRLGLYASADLAPITTVPCLLYAGEADDQFPPMKAYAARLPNATIFSLPGINHGAGFMRSDLVLPHVTAFLAKVRQ